MGEREFVVDKLMSDDDVILPESGVKYYDVKEDPFQVYGLYDYKNQDVYKRLPDEIGLNTNPGVAQLYLDTAGGRVRFSTDSDYVILCAYMPKIGHHSHMPLQGGAGFDLYEDNPVTGESVYVNTFRPPYNMTNGYVSIHKFKQKKLRYFTINFPTYSRVSKVELGLEETAKVGAGLPYRNKKPFVFYGSSITQGGCASRPGNNYISLVCRRLNLDYINLGFSGSGKAEDIIVDYMANLEMSAFISDYDHNAPNPEYLRQTHCNLYKKIREKNPSIPYLMMSRPDFIGAPDRVKDSIARRDVIIDTFRYAKEQGDENVYYIDGESYYHGQWEDACTVDRCHPNDMGFMFMADKVYATLRLFSFE